MPDAIAMNTSFLNSTAVHVELEGSAPPAVHVNPFVEYAVAVPPLTIATNLKFPNVTLDHVPELGNAPVAAHVVPLSIL